MRWKFIFVFLFVIQLSSDVVASKNTTGKVQSGKSRNARQGYETCECGMANDRRRRKCNGNIEMIIEGRVVKPVYKYPWMIGIFLHGQQTCGGSIISQTSVITAAHCVLRPLRLLKTVEDPSLCSVYPDNNEYCLVPLEDIELRFYGDRPGLRHVVYVAEVVMSLDFSVSPVRDDIAIIRTVEMLPCNKFTAPICLPTVSGLLQPRKKVIVAGWGQTSIFDLEGPVPSEAVLKEANLILESPEICDRIGGGTPHSVCCKASDGQACMGDSGGPLFKKFQGRYYLLGITSFGIGKECVINRPTFYTNVESYLPWIHRKMGQK